MTGKTQSMHGASCSCPVCQGLQCLERPRYFSGQLLTETDLNSEQEYMLAKQRLHNRYLHGSGIVCGLQVSCSPCDVGTITIQSGYAIDPCGNDIIVCDTQDFNVIQRIHDCEKARKRQRKGNCDPIAPPQDTDCRDREHHYCLTIAYTEQEARLTPTLRQGSTTATGKGNGCSCNGNGKKSGCSCNGSSASQMTQTMSASGMSSSSQSSQSSSAMSCQPTRILEGYQIDISDVPPDCCGDAKAALEDTLLAKVIDCFTSLKGFLDKKLPHNVFNVLAPLAFTGNIDDSVSWDDLYKYSCYLRQAIYELYTQDPLNTHCQTKDVLSQVVCQPPPCKPDDEQAAAQARTTYVEQMRTTLYDLLALLTQYMLDCVCQALLPPCPPTQTDDRLILACMTVRDDKIIDICNFCHRRYAGSFPALYYWLSLVPVIPLIAYAVERLCCYDWLKRDFTSDRQNDAQRAVFRGHLVNGLASLLDSVDPNGRLRQEIFADNFTLPKSYAAKVEQLINKVSSPVKVADLLQPKAFNLTQIIDKAVAEAIAALQAVGVIPVVQAVASVSEVPILRHLATSPFVAAGDHIVLYSVNDKVVGYTALMSLADIDQVKQDVTSLKENIAQVPQAADVTQLRSDVDTLNGNVANMAQSTALDEVRSEVATLKESVASAAQSTTLDEVKSEVTTLKESAASAAQSSALDEVKSEVATLKEGLGNAAQSTDLNEVKSEVATLKEGLGNAAHSPDLEEVKKNLAQLAQASDVNQLSGEIETLKESAAKAAQSTDLVAIRDDVETLKAADVSGMRDEVSQLKDEVATLRDLQATLKALQDELIALKGEVEQLKSRDTGGKEDTGDTPPVEPAQ